MLVFGIGAALPMLLLGTLSREALMRIRDKMIATGKWAKTGLGVMLLLIGLSVVTGYDHRIEAALIDASICCVRKTTP